MLQQWIFEVGGIAAVWNSIFASFKLLDYGV